MSLYCYKNFNNFVIKPTINVPTAAYATATFLNYFCYPPMRFLHQKVNAINATLDGQLALSASLSLQIVKVIAIYK